MRSQLRTVRTSRNWTRALSSTAALLGLLALASLAITASAASTATPANTTLPVITGTAQVGHSLTAQSGSWSGTSPIVFAYQWRRCDPVGASCADITGATSQSYALVAADASATLRISVTATNAEGTGKALSSPSPVVSAQSAPLNTAAPTISGTARAGETVTASNGTWTGSPPINFSYQWQICDGNGNACHDIAGQTAQTYTIQSADAGNTLRVSVKATNAGGSSTALSGSSAAIAPLGTAPANTSPPAISGNIVVGSALTIAPGNWSGTSPFTYSYGWQRCDANGNNCATIAGATAQSYTLTNADAGNRVRGIVTATNTAGTTTAYSQTSATIASLAPVNTVLPVISGTAALAQTLSASNGTWAGSTPISYSYQWARGNSKGGYDPITGATQAKYATVSADVGHPLYIQIKAQNSHGANWATSKPTTAITTTAPPAGTVQVNSVTLPNRLVISAVKFTPNVITSRAPFQARFRVTDAQGHPVQGALVYTIGLPYGWVKNAAEQPTAADGWATITIVPTTQLPLAQGRALVMFVRARKASDPLLAGVSNRRLVQITLR